MQNATQIKNAQAQSLIDQGEVGSKNISYRLIGLESQALQIQLDRGEKILAKAGSMSWMSFDVKVGTVLNKYGARFINYQTMLGPSILILTPAKPSKINAVSFDQQLSLCVRTSHLLCLEETLQFSGLTQIVRNKWPILGASQKFVEIKGTGTLHLSGGGEIVSYLVQDGEELMIDEQNLLAFMSGTRVELTTSHTSFPNTLWAGEGLSLLRVAGPGQIWLQTNKI